MANRDKIRRTSYAGSFYPEEELDLDRTLEALFNEANDGSPIDPRKPKALIVPHAGYIYSGAVAAKGYRQLEGHSYSKVLLIGPSHFNPKHGVHFQGPAPALYEKLDTPLGGIEYDKATAERLATRLNVEYQQAAHDGEHSLEVQFPFIARKLPGVLASLLLMGNCGYADTTRTAEAIAEIINEDNYLVLCSTDMSHFYPDKRAKELDGQSLEFIETGKAKGLFEWDNSGGGLLCGISAVLTLMQLAEMKGWEPPSLLANQTSGDRGGGRERVVGYASLAYYEPE